MARLIVMLAALAAASILESRDTVRVVIDTELGEIEVDIDRESAPRTSVNFLRYVDAGHYDGGQFHRTVTMQNQPNNDVKIEVIQASVNAVKRGDGFDAIAMERTTESGLSHKDGVISMARDAPDSATSSFFFCIGDQPELDYAGARNPDGQGFAAFGRIVRGKDVVRTIQMSSHAAQRLDPPIKIRSIQRLNSEDDVR